jgi:hypothetical protein
LNKDTIKPLFTGWLYGGEVANLIGGEQTFSKEVMRSIMKNYNKKGNFHKKKLMSSLNTAIDNFNNVLNNRNINFDGSNELITILKDGLSNTRTEIAADKLVELIQNKRTTLNNRLADLNRRITSLKEGEVENAQNELRNLMIAKDAIETFSSEFKVVE